MSGVYKTACITTGVSAGVAAGNYASDVQSLNWWFVVTGNDNVTQETHLYTDTSCSNSSLYYANLWDNVTVGTASGSNYSVTYNITGLNIVANTTAAESWVEDQVSGADLTLGTVYFMEDRRPEILKCSLWTPGDTTIYIGDSEDADGTCPTTAGELVYTKE